MSELEEAHECWLERKECELERLKKYEIAFDVAEIFAKDKEEKAFYHGARVAITDAIMFIKNGEI
jgi:hypothetical protein